MSKMKLCKTPVQPSSQPSPPSVAICGCLITSERQARFPPLCWAAAIVPQIWRKVTECAACLGCLPGLLVLIFEVNCWEEGRNKQQPDKPAYKRLWSWQDSAQQWNSVFWFACLFRAVCRPALMKDIDSSWESCLGQETNRCDWQLHCAAWPSSLMEPNMTWTNHVCIPLLFEGVPPSHERSWSSCGCDVVQAAIVCTLFWE